MEELLAKFGAGSVLFGVILGVCKFMLHHFLKSYDEKIDGIRELMTSEIKKAEHSFDLLFDKYDKMKEKLDNLKGYIEGQESNRKGVEK